MHLCTNKINKIILRSHVINFFILNFFRKSDLAGWSEPKNRCCVALGRVGLVLAKTGPVSVLGPVLTVFGPRFEDRSGPGLIFGRMAKPPSFDSPCRDESNGSGFILLWPLDAEIFGKTSKIRHFYICDTAPFDVLPNISASSGCRRMKPLPFDSSRHDESNDGGFIFLRYLDAEIFDILSKIQHFFKEQTLGE